MLRRLRHTQHSKCSAQRCVLHSMRERHSCFRSGPRAAHKLSPVLRTKLHPPTRPQTWSISCAVSFCWSEPASTPNASLKSEPCLTLKVLSFALQCGTGLAWQDELFREVGVRPLRLHCF